MRDTLTKNIKVGKDRSTMFCEDTVCEILYFLLQTLKPIIGTKTLQRFALPESRKKNSFVNKKLDTGYWIVDDEWKGANQKFSVGLWGVGDLIFNNKTSVKLVKLK